MRNFILAFATVAGTTSIAAAQPSLTASAPSAETTSAPDHYIGTGVALGADDAGIYSALTVEGGLRVHDWLWAHAVLAHGSVDGIDEQTYSGSFNQARVGLEARTCLEHGVVCGFAGIDAVVRDESLMAEYDNHHVTGLAAVTRLGTDVGTKHLRFRPALESIHDTGHGGIGVTGTLAYSF